jgi:hypothetical protein
MKALLDLPPLRWMLKHPRLSAWGVLSVGMVILLIIEARQVGLLPGQWAALIAACVLVAGVCIWIVSWEDSDEDAEADSAPGDAAPPPAA